MPSQPSDLAELTERPGRGRVQSVEVSISILSALARGGGPMSLKNISAEVGMPPAKVHRYLASFVDAGMMEQRRSGTYDLGPLATEIGVAAIGRSDFVNRAADRLEELVDETGATAMLSVWGNKGPTVVRWQRGPVDLTTTLGLGSVLPVLRSATGRVFLAFLPRRIAAAFVDEWLREPDAALDRNDIADIVETIRKERYAWVDQMYIPGLYAISAPVLNWQEEIEAAITLISRDAKIIDPQGSEIASLKVMTATTNTSGSVASTKDRGV